MPVISHPAWNQDDASAMLLLIPGMCLAIIIKFLDAAHQVKHLINLIMGWTLDLPLLMIWTVASLSQQKIIFLPFHSDPHRIADTTIGYSSKNAIDSCSLSLSINSAGHLP